MTAILNFVAERACARVNPPHPDPTMAIVGFEHMLEEDPTPLK